MNNNNSYVVKYKDIVLKVHPLRTEEVNSIFDFMSEVIINGDNYKEYLGIGCESLFK